MDALGCLACCFLVDMLAGKGCDFLGCRELVAAPTVYPALNVLRDGLFNCPSRQALNGNEVDLHLCVVQGLACGCVLGVGGWRACPRLWIADNQRLKRTP